MHTCTNALRCHLIKLLFLYVLTTCVILPVICYFLPYSRLYHFFHTMNEMHKKADNLNAGRLEKAKNYFKSIDSKESLNYYLNVLEQEVDIAVAIVTVRRKSLYGGEVGYLTQTAAYMDRIIKNDKMFRSKYLFLCNVDTFPDKHQEAVYIQRFMPLYQRYDNTTKVTSVREALYMKTVHNNNYEKETVDYMFCLESAMRWKPKYFLILEDDTVPCLSLFEVLKNKLTNQKIHSKLEEQDFSHIKLYYPQRWQGFSNDPERLLELLCYGLFGAGIVLMIQIFVNKVFQTKTSRDSYSYDVINFIFGAVYFITCVSLIGRQTMLDLRRILPSLYYFRESPGCCTQAMLYPLKVVPQLVDFLAKDNILFNFHTDLAIYEFVKTFKYPAYQVEPNLFYHTGMYTSLKFNEYKHPQEFLFSECH